MTYGVGEFLERAARQLLELRRAKARLDELDRLHEERRALLLRRREETTEELTRALLPELTPEALASAARATGFPGLLQQDFVGRAETERRALEARVAGIEADPRWRDRKLLRDPVVGRLTRAIAELEEFREPFASVVARCRHPRLARLLETGYGTPRYAVPFWRMSYYADWKAGDEILERFEGKGDFAAVLAEYLEAARTLETYDPKIASLREEVAAGARLEEELGACRQGLESLEARYHGLARIALAEHLEALPVESLGDVLETVPALGTVVKKWTGLDHQVRYLEAIRDVRIRPESDRLREAIRRLEKDVAKYHRPKNSGTVFPAEPFEKRFDPARTQKLEKRIGRMGEAQERVFAFDRWDRGSFSSDFLWWDLVTDGKVDGDFIPEVRSHYETYPGVRAERTLDEDDLAAAGGAVSASGPGRDGLLDVS